jgi:hypothetical protein
LISGGQTAEWFLLETGPRAADYAIYYSTSFNFVNKPCLTFPVFIAKNGEKRDKIVFFFVAA